MYANVILPLPFDRTFTYRVPDGLSDTLSVGSRVLVPFGAKKYYTAIVESLSPIKPADAFNIKDIAVIIDSSPILRHPQLNFWRWIADYYLSPIGDVFKAALPAGLKVESETIMEIAPEFDEEIVENLNGDKLIVFQQLCKDSRLSAKQLAEKTKLSNIELTVAAMIADGLLVVSEKIIERFARKKLTYVKLNTALPLTELVQSTHGAKKQEAVVLALIALSENGRNEVALSSLLEKSGATRSIVNALKKKGLLDVVSREVSRFSPIDNAINPLPQLSEPQAAALSQIHQSMLTHQTTLLHGVTSSGKTEIYIHLIDYVLQQGNQVLFLVPEIALTTQLTRRLQSVFGSQVVIYHSKFSDAERVEIWQRLLATNQPCVVIGARSAIFLPFAKLGLVIVDEEHESSYKQFDPSPRYNARDAAIMLSVMHGAKTLLGSATPSVETYYKAVNDKYGLVSLLTRYDDVPLPEIEIVDLSRERLKGRVVGSFAQTTVEAARKAIADGKQAIFFHNRRGYAPMARCRACQFIPKCDHCDVSLTYHKNTQALVCHYCGAVYPVMHTCPSCHEPSIEIVGYGTERVEDNIKSMFPESRIMRMDLDTTRNKDSYSRIIADFSAHKADILVGTQMVTKGLDFADVDVVAVVNADALIHYPDFRSAERAFNMLEQVAGRAGRRSSKGKVFVQTCEPSNPVIQYVSRHDYLAFYQNELEERRAFNYPPFARVINIFIKHRDETKLIEFANQYAGRLRQLFGNRVNGPREPQVSRIQSLFIRSVMLKIESTASMQKVKEILRGLYVEMQSSPLTKGFIIYYDVDPC